MTCKLNVSVTNVQQKRLSRKFTIRTKDNIFYSNKQKQLNDSIRKEQLTLHDPNKGKEKNSNRNTKRSFWGVLFSPFTDNVSNQIKTILLICVVYQLFSIWLKALIFEGLIADQKSLIKTLKKYP